MRTTSSCIILQTDDRIGNADNAKDVKNYRASDMKATAGKFPEKGDDNNRDLRDLPGKELASYVHDAARRMSRDTTEGTGLAMDQQVAFLTRIHEKYVVHLSWSDRADFWKEMYTMERNEGGRDFFSMLLDSFVKQDALISILIIEKRRTLEQERTNSHSTDPEWGKRIDLHKEQIQRLIERKRQIAQEVDEILDSHFWDTLGIARPDVTLIGEDEIG